MAISETTSVSGVNIAGTRLPLSDKIVTLGVMLDRHLALSHMAITVAVSMVHSRLDYANSLVHGHTNIKRLQSVQNSAARVVLKDNHHLSSGDPLRKLHWLPVESRIEFKIACITYKVLTTSQPTYLSTLLNHFNHYTPLRTLRSANQYRLQHQTSSQNVPIQIVFTLHSRHPPHLASACASDSVCLLTLHALQMLVLLL